jgi:cyanate permease
MAAGPVLGGLIFDATDSFAGLYVAALVSGLAAAALMAGFRPAARAAA